MSVVDADWTAFRTMVEDGVATVTMLGPGKGNTMGAAFFAELPALMAGLDADPQVRAIVLHGRDDTFSYGLDLTGMAPLFADMLEDGASATHRLTFLDELRRLQKAITSVAACRTPVVTAISGWCIGGGVDLASAADVRVASADARFSIREARMAIVADIGSLQRLVGIIGDGHLRQLSLTGEDFDAVRARDIGLVNDVHATPADSLAAAREIAFAVAANSPLVSRGIKEVLDVERAPRVDAGLRHVAAWNAAFLPSDDLREALAAFAERRAPVYRGR